MAVESSRDQGGTVEKDEMILPDGFLRLSAGDQEHSLKGPPPRRLFFISQGALPIATYIPYLHVI